MMKMSIESHASVAQFLTKKVKFFLTQLASVAEPEPVGAGPFWLEPEPVNLGPAPALTPSLLTMCNKQNRKKHFLRN